MTINERQREFFGSETYLSFDTGYPERDITWFRHNLLPDILKMVPEHWQKSLLDVGCAAGYFARWMALHFAYTEGVDYVETRIGYAKRFENAKLRFTVLDLTQSFDLHRQFDVLFTNAVMPHIPLENKVQVFDNLAGVAAPGAMFLMYDGKCDTGVIDNFCGLMSPGWIRDHVKSWNLVSTEHIFEGTYRFLLTKV